MQFGHLIPAWPGIRAFLRAFIWVHLQFICYSLLARKRTRNSFLIKSQEKLLLSGNLDINIDINEHSLEKLLTLFSWFLLFWRSVMTQLWMKKASVRTPVSWGNRILNSKWRKKEVFLNYLLETSNAKMQTTYSALEGTGKLMSLHPEMGQSISSLTINTNAGI